MNEYLIYIFQAFSAPSVVIRKIEGFDIVNAIQSSGVPVNEIICIKLKAPIAIDEE